MYCILGSVSSRQSLQRSQSDYLIVCFDYLDVLYLNTYCFWCLSWQSLWDKHQFSGICVCFYVIVYHQTKEAFVLPILNSSHSLCGQVDIIERNFWLTLCENSSVGFQSLEKVRKGLREKRRSKTVSLDFHLKHYFNIFPWNNLNFSDGQIVRVWKNYQIHQTLLVTLSFNAWNSCGYWETNTYSKWTNLVPICWYDKLKSNTLPTSDLSIRITWKRDVVMMRLQLWGWLPVFYNFSIRFTKLFFK